MTSPLLYSFRRCPYAMRARLGLLVAKIPVRIREIELKNKPQSMLEVSPKGTVPVMIVSDSQNKKVIEESLDIMLWALTSNDPHHILATYSQQTETVLALIERNDQEFKHWLDRYKYADRFPEHGQSHYLSMACSFIENLETRLSQHTFLFGAKPSIADLAIFPFIRQFAFVDKKKFDSLPYPNLQCWLNYWLEHSWFESIMKKYQPWLLHEQEYFL
ncbi:glutathione S-transferase [Parashewanella curva]|uniref:Glutathione S-transferase n=1 Tax=Parashewanella curva TaxID=2338552 RepID=A0A3L8PZ74_9GAMM|nr:glutathione S-transferase [Parashewanella curva]RLV60661.1 glutathione S-transferase [Parashewanella curva]